MKETIYSSWSSFLLSTIGWLVMLVYGLSKYGFSHGVQMGILVVILCEIWLVWERYHTYVAIEDNRWLINSEDEITSIDKIDIFSLVYIARTGHFVFRSWGGRMVFFLKDDTGEVRQTYVPETSYTEESLFQILKSMRKVNPAIEFDDEYTAFMAASKENNVASIKSDVPKRSVTEVEAYVRAKYVNST